AIENSLKEGAKEIWITSQDLGCYGIDRKTNIVNLLNLIKNIEGKLMKIKGIKEERIRKETKEIPKEITTITFKKTVTAEDGAKIPIVRRITVNEKGEIIKDTGN
ncbi:MAG: hypothetical protein ACK4YO_03515, partial [Candidatus Altarchaeaceae archaeon]